MITLHKKEKKKIIPPKEGKTVYYLVNLPPNVYPSIKIIYHDATHK